MKLINASYKILLPNADEVIRFLWLIERNARRCTGTMGKQLDTPNLEFIRRRITDRHMSVLEHSLLAVEFVVDLRVATEILRHRITTIDEEGIIHEAGTQRKAVSGESSRYCNLAGEMQFVVPPWCQTIPCGDYPMRWQGIWGYRECAPADLDHNDARWFWNCAVCERDYQALIENGWRPEQARDVLIKSTATSLGITANWTEWRHIFRLRTDHTAHPQMREIMRPLLREAQALIPVIFDDIQPEG